MIPCRQSMMPSPVVATPKPYIDRYTEHWLSFLRAL